MLQKEWALAPAAPAERLQRFREVSPILAQMLVDRGFEDPASARAFIHNSNLDEDPFALKDVEKAVDRIGLAIERRQPTVVYGDFDADGVCATTLLVQTLKALGADVSPYIPDRDGEGYGLNAPALRQLAQQGAQLVITVDCGIRSIAEVEAGARAGLDIIVTDHHSIGPELPAALAVINPRQDDCAGEAGLAGVGVAFMLAKGLLRRRWDSDRASYPPGFRQSDLLDLVALGTVADVMSLKTGLNRRLVRHGLDTINEFRRPGIAALARVAGLKAGQIRASDLGFGLGPRVNAAGRLGSAMTAYDLLSARTLDDALPCAVELQRLNQERQRLTRQAQTAISEQVSEADELHLIFAGDEGLLPGIVGLVAGQLSQEYYRPAVVLEFGADESRASCRSIPEFDITRALDECADLLVKHGGHAMAAGFTVRNENIDVLRLELQRKAQASLRGRRLTPRLPVDCEAKLSDISMALVAELDLLEPTGHGNPQATFLTRDLNVLHSRRVGAEKQHLKLRLADADSSPIDAIGFGLGDWALKMPRRIDCVYHAEINEWNGRRTLQMRLLDLRPAGEASRTVSA
ncbi:MAG: single-stranded-DNA-specific exonuclease RecJ [Chloroflexi bacterium]|nr:single-stranded-DNA-specific exonuclease RecJ [Chloroflexota bacterium]